MRESASSAKSLGVTFNRRQGRHSGDSINIIGFLCASGVHLFTPTCCDRACTVCGTTPRYGDRNEFEIPRVAVHVEQTLQAVVRQPCAKLSFDEASDFNGALPRAETPPLPPATSSELHEAAAAAARPCTLPSGSAPRSPFAESGGPSPGSWRSQTEAPLMRTDTCTRPRRGGRVSGRHTAKSVARGTSKPGYSRQPGVCSQCRTRKQRLCEGRAPRCA